MVEPVMPAGGTARLDRAARDGAARPETAAARAVRSLAAPQTGETVEFGAATRGLAQGMRADPPVDLAAVSRIKTAIADGRYPVDLERITEALFDDYLNLML